MPIPITARGAEKLKEELQRLKSADRPAVIQAIKEAREKGDLSENAEYDAARERQGFIEGRIQELEGKVGALQIIDPAAVDAGGRIVFGATVALEDLVAGVQVKYQIVGDDEADIKAGKFHPFAGPVKDNEGKERLAAGKTLDDGTLNKMDYYVEGVQGQLPKK